MEPEATPVPSPAPCAAVPPRGSTAPQTRDARLMGTPNGGLMTVGGVAVIVSANPTTVDDVPREEDCPYSINLFLGASARAHFPVILKEERIKRASEA